MGEQGSDKGHANITASRHNYTTLYYHLFKDMRHKPLRVFELGLGTNNLDVPSNMGPQGRPGASLYGWNQFFPSAKIFGADIDTRILFNTPAIQTYYCDQTNPRVIHKMWETPELREPFDIIVEDGLHAFDANVCFFENSIHRLAKGGYYIIEDITNPDKTKFEEILKEWRQIYMDLTFTLVAIPSTRNDWDNTLLVVKKAE
jgi:SAM-dependent methyltransferase